MASCQFHLGLLNKKSHLPFATSLFTYLVKSVVVFLKSVAVVLKSILVVLNKGAPAVLHCVVVEPVLGRYEVGGGVRLVPLLSLSVAPRLEQTA